MRASSTERPFTVPDTSATDLLAERKKLTAAYARVVKAARVKHVVFLSSIGAQHAKGNGPIATLHYAEERLARTSAKLTLVRAGYFLENPEPVPGWGGRWRLPVEFCKSSTPNLRNSASMRPRNFGNRIAIRAKASTSESVQQ